MVASAWLLVGKEGEFNLTPLPGQGMLMNIMQHYDVEYSPRKSPYICISTTFSITAPTSQRRLIRQLSQLTWKQYTQNTQRRWTPAAPHDSCIIWYNRSQQYILRSNPVYHTSPSRILQQPRHVALPSSSTGDMMCHHHQCRVMPLALFCGGLH